MLKSDGFASNIYDPNGEFTLQHFCAERQIKYSDTGIPVGLDTFSDYGLAFRDRMVPELEDKLVVGIDRVEGGFLLRLDDGELVKSKRVVLAVGITNFQYIPDNLSHLPPELLSHSYRHHDLESFRGRKVVVLGAGSSAIDLAALLRDADADVELVARANCLEVSYGARAGQIPFLVAANSPSTIGAWPGHAIAILFRFAGIVPLFAREFPSGDRTKAS